MQSIQSAIRQKWFWACQNKPFWVHLGLFVLTLPFLFVRPAFVGGTPTDLPIRAWGMVLQLFGAATVWIDLTNTAKDFGVHRLTVMEWLKKFNGYPPIEGNLIVVEEGDTMRVTGHVPTITQSGQSSEERLTRMEKEFLTLIIELAATKEVIRNQRRELLAEIENSAAKLDQELGGLQHQLKDSFVGNYTALRVGAIWLVVGIILSSVAVELTNLLHLCNLPAFW